MTYRPDIDGLRAVAVIAVIIFHLNAAWLPGGFLGVDIFFVISGYLIGGILYRELTTHTFSLKRFYLRRMRRILPAFFAVVIFTLVVGSVLMVPGSDDWNTTRTAARWSVLFGGNIFSAQNVDYWATSTEVQPLNHLWSLAVEEQFYFIYPLLLWGLMKMLRKMTPSFAKSSARSLEIILTILAIASFALAFVPVVWGGNTLIAYYLPHLRFGELLIGAILAVMVAQQTEEPKAGTANIVGTLSALLLLVCLVVEFPNQTPWFPGFAAAIPCVASAGIIYAGGRGYWFSRILSHRAVVFVGKISYSLYLWHWVVLAFARNVWSTQLSYSLLIGACCATLALSLLTYYFLEQPLRHLQWSFGRTAVVYYLLPLFVGTGLYLQGRTLPDNMRPYVSRGSYTLGENEMAYCSIGDTTQTASVLVLGNSYTLQLHDFFDRVGQHEGWGGTLSGVSASFPLHLWASKPISPAEYERAVASVGHSGKWKEQLNELRSRRIMTDFARFHTVIISLNWYNMEFVEKAQRNVLRTIGFLLKSGKRVVLVNSCMDYTTNRMTLTYLRMKGWNTSFAAWLPDANLRGKSYEAGMQRVAEVRDIVAREYPTVRWVDLVPYIPTSLLHNGKSVLCNNNHLSVYGAHYLADRFIADHKKLIEMP